MLSHHYDGKTSGLFGSRKRAEHTFLVASDLNGHHQRDILLHSKAPDKQLDCYLDCGTNLFMLDLWTYPSQESIFNHFCNRIYCVNDILSCSL